MTFAKLVVNALPAGVYGAVVVLLLLAIANPSLAAAPVADRAVILGLVLPIHAAAAALMWALLYGGLRYFASHPLRLGWLSWRYVMGFQVAHGVVLVASAWTTLSRFRRSLGPEAADRLAGLCVALSLAWVIAAIVSALPRLRRMKRAQQVGAALALAALLAAGRGGGRNGTPAPESLRAAVALPVPSRLVLLLNFDGADLETILTMQAEGKLPAFTRLLREGAHGKLRSLSPCEAPVVRATLLTGRLPHRHGVRSARTRRFVTGGPWIDITPAGLQFDRLLAPFLEERERTAEDRVVLALPGIAARAGGLGAADGWTVDADRPGWRARIWEGAWPAWLPDYLDPDGLSPDDRLARLLVGEIAAAREADDAVAAALDRVTTDRRPGVLALSFPGLDRIAHLFLRHARPREFGGGRDPEAATYGRVLEAHYRRMDALVARALLAGGEDAVLFVTSTHGIDPVPLPERLLRGAPGTLRRSGTHATAPDGFLLARGPGIDPDRRFGKGALADAAPTILYALGLPAARDFDGAILAGVFRPAYTFDHPVTVIGSYEAAR